MECGAPEQRNEARPTNGADGRFSRGSRRDLPEQPCLRDDHLRFPREGREAWPPAPLPTRRARKPQSILRIAHETTGARPTRATAPRPEAVKNEDRLGALFEARGQPQA